MANAKMNIGDCNGMGLEWIFRGQSHWGKYKDNEALFIKGPATHNKQKIVIFAGGAVSYTHLNRKKIRLSVELVKHIWMHIISGRMTSHRTIC